MASGFDRRSFLTHTARTAIGGTVLGGVARRALSEQTSERSRPASAVWAGTPVRVGVIGCGSVSGMYLPHLKACPYARVVSLCDIRPERSAARAKEFGVAHHYANLEEQLAGEPVDLLVVLTDMQAHEQINRRAIETGKHVWSEKPLANSLSAGQDLLALARSRNVTLLGAPVVVNSPQFEFMAKTARAGTLGRLAAAHAAYGHTGPGWSSFFYEKGGGSMPDLGVYNLTTLTGLLGPARRVTAMTSIVTPTRRIDEKGEIRVEAEDNAMVLLDHGNGVVSHVMCGFNYFDPHGHDARAQTRSTLSVIGNAGSMHLVGYDWEPKGVDLATQEKPEHARHAQDARGYVWQEGASMLAEHLATGKPLRVTAEHALHVLEIMEAARESQESGRRVDLTSTFSWPVV